MDPSHWHLVPHGILVTSSGRGLRRKLTSGKYLLWVCSFSINGRAAGNEMFNQHGVTRQLCGLAPRAARAQLRMAALPQY